MLPESIFASFRLNNENLDSSQRVLIIASRVSIESQLRLKLKMAQQVKGILEKWYMNMLRQYHAILEDRGRSPHCTVATED